MKYPISREFKWLQYIHMSKNLNLLKWQNYFVNAMYSLQPVGSKIMVKKLDIPLRDGNTLRVDLFYPKAMQGPYKTMIYFPGGGFLMTASHYHKKNLCRIVNDTFALGVMVHYRLAPTHPFPTFFYDAIDTLAYLTKHAEELMIDINRMGLGGDSAGGNIACGLALYNQDYLHYPLKSLMLIYPGLAKGISTETRRLYVDTPMFNASMFPLIEKVVYQNGLYGLDHYAFPLDHPRLESLKYVYVETAEYDCLRDDGRLFYQKLINKNVAVTYNETLGTVHGYDIVKNSPITKSSLQKRSDFVNKTL